MLRHGRCRLTSLPSADVERSPDLRSSCSQVVEGLGLHPVHHGLSLYQNNRLDSRTMAGGLTYILECKIHSTSSRSMYSSSMARHARRAHGRLHDCRAGYPHCSCSRCPQRTFNRLYLARPRLQASSSSDPQAEHVNSYRRNCRPNACSAR